MHFSYIIGTATVAPGGQCDYALVASFRQSASPTHHYWGCIDRRLPDNFHYIHQRGGMYLHKAQQQSFSWALVVRLLRQNF